VGESFNRSKTSHDFWRSNFDTAVFGNRSNSEALHILERIVKLITQFSCKPSVPSLIGVPRTMESMSRVNF
jgi:hypothetical protein